MVSRRKAILVTSAAPLRRRTHPPRRRIRRRGSNIRTCGGRFRLMTATWGGRQGLRRRWLLKMRRRRDRSWGAVGCRRAACGRWWGDCRRRQCWQRRRCVRGGERQRGGYGGPRRSSGLGFRRGLRLGLLDRCCRSVRGLLGSLLEWKG